MRKFATALLLVVALTLGLAGTATAASAPSVRGGGQIDYYGYIIAVTFTANQVDAATGAAKGQFEYNYYVGDKLQLHGEVLYMTVEGNNAWIGLVVTECTYSTMIGEEYVFEVQDNGQGKQATGPDSISGFWERPASDALSKPDMSLSFWPLYRGNIQVFPGE